MRAINSFLYIQPFLNLKHIDLWPPNTRSFNQVIISLQEDKTGTPGSPVIFYLAIIITLGDFMCCDSKCWVWLDNHAVP